MLAISIIDMIAYKFFLSAGLKRSERPMRKAMARHPLGLLIRVASVDDGTRRLSILLSGLAMVVVASGRPPSHICCRRLLNAVWLTGHSNVLYSAPAH
jgi:hypothetical protein